jgi:RNase adaptor protein for sRNA GlmZ degradation
MVTKKTSSTTKAETATVKAEKKGTAAAKAIETKKDTTKKLETKAAVLVDTPEVQAEEVKETVKKAAKKVAAKAEDTAEKAVKTVKKAAAKKTATKTTKKADLKTEFFLQFSGKEYTEKEILKKVKDVWTKDLKNKVGDMKDVKIYLKPEESAAYYVVNGDTTGKIDL